MCAWQRNSAAPAVCSIHILPHSVSYSIIYTLSWSDTPWPDWVGGVWSDHNVHSYHICCITFGAACLHGLRPCIPRRLRPAVQQRRSCIHCVTGSIIHLTFCILSSLTLMLTLDGCLRTSNESMPVTRAQSQATSLPWAAVVTKLRATPALHL